MNKGTYLLPLVIISGFLFLVGSDLYRSYFGGEARPFTKGLYRKSIAGRIGEMSLYKNEVTIKLEQSDSMYFFLPHRNLLLTDKDFWDLVQDGDSLWKNSMSDTVYILGHDSIVYSWTFSTEDKFGRSYLEQERDTL